MVIDAAYQSRSPRMCPIKITKDRDGDDKSWRKRRCPYAM